MSLLSSLAGAPLIKGNRQKGLTARASGEVAAVANLTLVRHSEKACCNLPGQRADTPKSEASKAGKVSPGTYLHLTLAQTPRQAACSKC